MKKIWMLGALLLVSAPLFAQSATKKDPTWLYHILRKTISQQEAAHIAWHRELRQMQNMWEKVRISASHHDPIPVIMYTPLSHQDEPIYLRRILQLQQCVEANKLLRGYKFVAPVQADLAKFSPDNYAALLAFLKNLQLVKVTHLERVQPFTLAVQIQGNPQGALEVWIDVPSKKVYLMSNNLYTTANGKYGLHLK